MSAVHRPRDRAGYLRALSGGTLLALGILTVACDPPGRVPTVEEQSSVLSKMRFERHPNGLCFGMVSFSTHSDYTVVSIVPVPDAACRPAEAGETLLVRDSAVDVSGAGTQRVAPAVMTWNESSKTVTITRAFPPDGQICFESSTLDKGPGLPATVCAGAIELGARVSRVQ